MMVLLHHAVFSLLTSVIFIGGLSAMFTSEPAFVQFDQYTKDFTNYAGNYASMVNTSRATFKKYFTSSSIIADRFNNDDSPPNRVALACASELFVTSCKNAGMAAMILMTLDHINLCLKIGAKPTVFWRNCYAVCPKDGTINAWEMFFQPVNPNIEKTAKKVLCIGFGVASNHLLNLSFRKRHAIGFEETGIITSRIRKKAHRLLQEFIKVTPKIQGMVENFYSEHLSNFNVVAVHIRGTDHDIETEEGKLPPLGLWIEKAKNILRSVPSLNKIFIASDNTESIRRFVQEFGDKVIYTNAFRARKYYGRAVHDSGADPYMIGSQVLVDILLMAKCKHFLHAESSVAALVTYFNPDIESHFLEYKKKGVKRSISERSNNNNAEHFPPGDEEDDEDEEDEEDDDAEGEANEAYSCFLQNRHYSVCPNMRKGIFVQLKTL